MDKKPYLIEGVIGNSRLLASLGSKGELYRLFWPNIDFPQHINIHQAGLILPNKRNHIIWFNEHAWETRQNYIARTNILETEFVHRDYGIKVTSQDFVPKGEDLLVRNFKIENLSATSTQVILVYFSDFHVAESEKYNSAIYDREHHCLVHFRNDYAFSVGADREPNSFQCGHSWEAAQQGNLNNQDVCPLSDGCLKWDLGVVNPNKTAELCVYIGCGRNIEGALWQYKRGKQIGANNLLNQTSSYWQNFLLRARTFNIKDSIAKEVYERSLLTLALMQDEEHGGIIAAPEFDENFSRCGGYGFCWGRDAAFITRAFDEAGYHKEVNDFYRWAIRAQSPSGAWLQRHYMNGNLAPTWGNQIDETASIIWGAWKHFKENGDIRFLRDFWPYLEKGANFLTEHINQAKNLPDGSYDLWEERFGIHAYSTAAVIAGLRASAKCALELEEVKLQIKWEQVADKLKTALDKLWRENLHRFVRTLNGDTYQHEDHEIDISLLGLTIPFLVYDPLDERIQQMAKLLENNLTSEKTGGIKRYVQDTYIGGNPWVLCTLWLAQYYIATEEFAKAKNLFNWVIDHRTKLSLLPEQVQKDTGEPAWVIPLTWSHAMFVLTAIGLAKAEQI